MPYKDKEKQKEFQRAWWNTKCLEWRKQAFIIMGDKCVRCGIDDKRVLEFDHIVPILRKTSGIESGRHLARMIAQGKIDPELLQVLCANCHTIKTYYEDNQKVVNQD